MAPPFSAETVLGAKQFDQSKQKATAHPVSHFVALSLGQKQASPAFTVKSVKSLFLTQSCCHVKGKKTTRPLLQTTFITSDRAKHLAAFSAWAPGSVWLWLPSHLTGC